MAGRTLSKAEGLIGCFMNVLVMRTRLFGNPSFAELLKRVRDTALQAYARQETPFERLVEELQPTGKSAVGLCFRSCSIYAICPTAQCRKRRAFSWSHIQSVGARLAVST